MKKLTFILLALQLSACASMNSQLVITDPKGRAPEVQARDSEYCRTYGLSVARTQSGAAVEHDNCMLKRGYEITEQRIW